VIIVANEKNLIPFTSNQDREEARKNGRKGGIRSGEVRREKATMKKTLEMLLDEKNKEGKTYRELSTLGLIKGAVDGKAENYKIILQLLGELTQDLNAVVEAPTININIADNEDLEKVLYEKE
jgi:hypothetical protein